jgi:hypothetical protein
MNQRMEIPQEIIEAINEVVEKGDYEYADNYRFYRIHDLQGLSDFQRAEDRGCCGSHDEQVTVNGVEYMIGFNYGH